MSAKKPRAPLRAKKRKKGIVQADAESTKKAASKKAPKKRRRTRESSKTPDLVATESQITNSMEKGGMEQKTMMQVPDAVREVAEKTVEQAEKAFNSFLNAANQSVAIIPGPAAEISKKTLAFTEQNMKAAFDYARKLLHAKDMQEVMQIQSEFFRSQFTAAQEQMKQMSADAVSTAKDVIRDISKSKV
jgi:phasin